MNRIGSALLVATVSVTLGCATGPSGVNVEGTYIGSYTVSTQPAFTFQGVLQLTQHGNDVTGTLTSNAGRAARVIGSVSGSRVTTTYSFTDNCHGTASAVADVTQGGTRLSGNYTANDCNGQYSGGFLLERQ